MSYLKINKEKLSPAIAAQTAALCPFGALTAKGAELEIGGGCRMCKLCAKKSGGVIELVEENVKSVDKSQWRGITVYADIREGRVHPVTYELIGKAKELAEKIKQPVYTVAIGSNMAAASAELLTYGVDKVFTYDYPQLESYLPELYANALEDFINTVKPCAILVGATNIGRSLAPRIAARFNTGLTADCTSLEIKENTDLVQIRPAFGGNIMAQILTPNTRPQLCTVRYKIFNAPAPVTPHGELVRMELPAEKLLCGSEVLAVEKKAAEKDISEADVIVAVGRGIKSKADIAEAAKLADLLGAQMACSRPLVENGWFDAKKQIGLSGRTVKPKLIIALGVSGSVQFAAGMKSSDCIIAVNTDKNAPIMSIAHYGIVGDIYEILPLLIKAVGERRCGNVQQNG